ncbi:MAG: adenosyl-hopene transferase HpnH [Kiloniellales bacterium]
MGVPLLQQLRVGAYLIGNRLRGNDKYPLVLMLEPLFRCNLACPGCGKIDYPDSILNLRLTYEECMAAVDECPAPIVSIPGGEPLLHKEIADIVAGILRRKKFVYLCTNALLMEKKLHLFRPSRYFTWSVHLDGDEAHHDKAVDQAGTYQVAVAAIRKAKRQGFRVNINCTLFDGADTAAITDFFDVVSGELDIDGITVSPGYAYERAPDQEHFLNRHKTKQLFRDLFRRGRGRGWRLSQSALFLDFLAGNQTYRCTPWGNPTRNVFGWQRPCYLLGEGYADSFQELMETTEWDQYGTGNYEKCADCMVHCGYEATAVADTLRRPLTAARVAFRGPKTEGPMAPEIPLAAARPADNVFEQHVMEVMAGIQPTKRDQRWLDAKNIKLSEKAEAKAGNAAAV